MSTLLRDKVFEDVGTERLVLAAIVNIPESIIQIADVVKEYDFVVPHNRNLYSCLCSLYRGSSMVSFDVSSVLVHARSLEMLEECGGVSYITAVFDTPVMEDNIGSYVKFVVENGTKKYLFDSLLSLSEEVKNNASGPSIKPVSELITLSEERISDVVGRTTRVEDAVNLGDGIEEFLEGIINTSPDDGIRGLRTGFKAFDSRMLGLSPGSLTIVAARPKVGKSCLLNCWATYAAYKVGTPVLYIDTEMTTSEVRTRILSELSNVSEVDIKSGRFAKDEHSRDLVFKAAAIFKNGKFFHKYMPGVSPDKVVGLARTYKVKYDIGAIFFDYIKMPDSADLNNAKEHQILGKITSTFKDLAGILGVPVVSAAQIGRVGEGKSHLQPGMIADSDRLLRYCNTLLALCRKSKEETLKGIEEYGLPSELEYIKQYGSHRLQILETRGGGSFFEGINLTFFKKFLRFSEAVYPTPRADGKFGDEEDSDF